MRGQKVCPSCGTTTGPRAYSCKNCNHVFVFKATSKEHKNTKIIRNFDWKSLKKGDKIKVSGGPYYLHEGELIPMGYRGKFIVEAVDSKGIQAFGIDKTCGFAHIYMGEDYQNADTGIWKTKHKLLKLKLKNQELVS